MTNIIDTICTKNVKVRIDRQVISIKQRSFKYLGSIIQVNGEIDDNVTHHTKIELVKWKFLSSIFCAKNMPPITKVSFMNSH